MHHFTKLAFTLATKNLINNMHLAHFPSNLLFHEKTVILDDLGQNPGGFHGERGLAVGPADVGVTSVIAANSNQLGRSGKSPPEL